MPEIRCVKRNSDDIDVISILGAIDDIRASSGKSSFIAALNPSCFCSSEQAISAFEKALRSFRSGRSRAKTPEGEFFRTIAMKPQINQAIERCGISRDNAIFCFVYDGITTREFNAFLDKMHFERTAIPVCTEEKLSDFGLETQEGLLESIAFFDAGIHD